MKEELFSLKEKNTWGSVPIEKGTAFKDTTGLLD
jgi:hypothetical protein